MPQGNDDEVEVMARVQALWNAGRVDEAVRLLRRAKETLPEHSPWVDSWLSSALLQSDAQHERDEGAALAAGLPEDESGDFAQRTIDRAGNPRAGRLAKSSSGQMGATRLTPMVLGLIALNALVFVLSGFGKASILDRFAMVPALAHHEPYRLLTSPFFHLSVEHIALNMFTLAIVGSPVEALLGRARFLGLYLLSGLGGSVGFYLLAPLNEGGVGASGAIFGLMGAYFVLARRNGWTTAPVVVLIVLNLIYGFVVAGVGWQAHVGGLFTGAVLTLGLSIGRRAVTHSRRITYEVATYLTMLAILAALMLVPLSSVTT